MQARYEQQRRSLRRGQPHGDMASRSTSFDTRIRSEDSWVEISSQPSSSSLSSVNDEIVTTGLRVQHDPRTRRRRVLRPSAPSHLNISQATSSQEEYEESESESDRVMTSSGEDLQLPGHTYPSLASQSSPSDSSVPPLSDDDEDRTAINYPLNHNNITCFTPQPNAFSHPPTQTSYFPSSSRPAPNTLAPIPAAAAHHDEALRASLSTLLSCAAAARGLPNKSDARPKQQHHQPHRPDPSSNRVDPLTLHLIPPSFTSDPHFKPTLHRRRRSRSTSTSISSSKRKASANSGRSAAKKARHQHEDVSPTLLTWVGVVVVLSALSFSAGYSVGRRVERVGVCGREAGLLGGGGGGGGVKRGLARGAVRV